MTFLYVAAFERPAWSTAAIVARALERAGYRVVRAEDSEHTAASLLALAAELRPDVHLFHKLSLCDAGNWPENGAAVAAMLQSLRAHCASLVCWNFEWLFQQDVPARWRWALAVSPHVDVFATTDAGAAAELGNGLALRQGVPEDIDAAEPWQPAEFAGDVLFLGELYGPEREALGAALRGAFGARFAHARDVRGPALTRLVRSYRLCVGPQWPLLPGYWSNRIYVVAGHGGLFVAPSVPGMEAEGWVSCSTYFGTGNDPDSIVERCRSLLAGDPEPLGIVRRQGFELAGCLTYDARAAALVKQIEAH